MKKYLFFLIFPYLTISCDYNRVYENRESDKKEAQNVINKFYYLTQENKKDETMKLFSNRFFKDVNKKKFKEILNKTDNDFGKTKDFELINSWTQIIKGSDPISKYELSYLVTRDSTQTKEYFRMQKENDTIKIISYRVDFDIVSKK